jgi:speckle-type POZ protein
MHVAAERYAMDRLKLMCQNILVGDKLDVENVATTLGLAYQYNCDRLKDVCIEFVMNLEDKNAVMETEVYANLRRTCPSVIVEVYERTNKRSRICK